ncbi:MAG: cell division protein SepF [Clostridia bacterium]|nr:cell division protein SepF [Clostridia bacterium]
MATQGIGLSGLSQMSSGISLSGTALELKVVKPQHFDSVPQIADHLLNKRTVVLNLENTNKETARRLIDFLSGVAYSIDGSLKKIASNAYVITPSNVDVGDAQLRDKRQRAEQQEAAPAAENDLGEF